MTLEKLLCVDDELQLIEGISLHLRREYAVTAAHRGAQKRSTHLPNFALAQQEKVEVRELPFVAIREGMVLAQELKLANGTLAVARGYDITATFVERAQHFRSGHVKGPMRVIVRGGAP